MKIQFVQKFILFSLRLITYCLFLNSCEKRIQNSDREGAYYVKQVSQMIVASLKYKNINQLPRDNIQRLRVIDECVYQYRLMRTDQHNAQLKKQKNNENANDIEPYYPSMNRCDRFLSGFKNNNLLDTTFTFYVIWNNANNSKWSGAGITCDIDGNILKKISLDDVDQLWIDSNLDVFPFKNGKTYKLLKNHNVYAHDSGMKKGQTPSSE